MLPLLEDLEGRIVLSQLLPPGASPADSGVATPAGGLVPYPLAHGGSVWMALPGSTALPTAAQAGVSGGPQSAADVLLGGLPAASPLAAGHSLQATGPVGFTPIQIQTAYGLSDGGAYNDGISFAGIRGDGQGQTIGLYEEGYYPDFVSTNPANTIRPTPPPSAPAPWRRSTANSACPTAVSA